MKGNSCDIDETTNVQYFTVVGGYLREGNAEVISWFLMLSLIVFDLFLVDIKAKQVLLLCMLFVFDVLLGFLYMKRTISFQFNLFFRLLFVIVYPRLTRVIFSNYIHFVYKIRKVLAIYLSMIIFSGLVLFTLYFDSGESTHDLYYSKMDFSTISNAVYSSYTIFNHQNVLSLFSFTLHNNPEYTLFLIPLYYCTILITVSFIIAMIAYFYAKTVRRQVKSLKKYRGV